MFGPLQRNSNSHPSCRHRSQSSLGPFLLLAGDFLCLHHLRGVLSLCQCLPWLRAESTAVLLFSCSTQSRWCPWVLCGLCSPTGISGCLVYLLVVLLPTAGLRLHWLWLRCPQVLQFHWENCYSYKRDPALLGTCGDHGNCVKALPVSVEELGSLTPLQTAFIAPRTLSVVYMWIE